MPQLERSVAVPTLERRETIRPQRKASFTDLEQMVKDFKKERNYSSAEHVMDQIDGLKPIRRSLSLDECDKIEEQLAMENHENMRKIPEGVPPMFRPILDHIEHELDYIRMNGIEQFLEDYTHRKEGLSCLRDKRYLNAQLLFLEKNV